MTRIRPTRNIFSNHRRHGSVPTWVILVLVLLAAASPFILARGKGTDHVDWRTDLEAAKVEAASTCRPLFIDFTADWCPPCKVMKRDVFSRPAVEQVLEEQFIPVKIDLTDRTGPGAGIAARYQVTGIPTLIIADAEGHVVRRYVGGIGPDLLLKWLAEKD